MTDTVIGDDGLRRCGWGSGPPINREYHDREWGRPERDERRVFETLSLEGFQSGLSWITILRKRPAFREAFASFDPEKVALFADAEIESIVADPGVVRHRGKILATINNAQATIRLHERGESLSELLWAYWPEPAAAPESGSDLVASSPESKALSGELRRRGFKFVGPTTVYSTMQALGIVDDHLAGCAFRGAPSLP